MISRLSDIDENEHYFEGWMRITHEHEIENWIWIYSHQTHTHYINKYNKTHSNKSKKLLHAQYTTDNDTTNKYITHIKTIRENCARAKPQRHRNNNKTNKTPLRTRKRDCDCYILVKIYKISSTDDISQHEHVAVISANYPQLHKSHNLEWENRCNAPLPRPLKERIKLLA